MSHVIGALSISLLLAASALLLATQQTHTLPAAVAGMVSLAVILVTASRHPSTPKE